MRKILSYLWMMCCLSVSPLMAESFIYVTNFGNDTVTVLNSDGSFHSILSGAPYNFSGPLMAATSSVTGKTYVLNFGPSQDITVINPDTSVDTHISLPIAASNIAISPLSGRIYVTNASTSTLTIYNFDNTLNTTLSGSPFNLPTGVAVSPLTGRVYVLNTGDQSLIILNPDNSIKAQLSGALYGFNFAANSISISPVNGKIYIGNRNSTTVTVLNSDDTFNALLSGAPYNFSGPDQNLVSPVTGEVYIWNLGNSTVTVINPDNSFNTIISPLVTTEFNQPFGINPTTGEIYIAELTLNSVNIYTSENILERVLTGSPYNFNNPATIALSIGLAGPSSLSVSQAENRYLKQADLVNVLTWSSVPFAASYNVYRNGLLIANVSAGATIYRDHNRKPGIADTYFIRTVNSAGQEGAISPSASSMGSSG